MLVAGLLGLYQLRRMLDRYTETQPMPLPAVEVAPEKLQQIQRRVEAFRDDLRAGRYPPPLALTSEEINALISHDPELQSLSGKVFVVLEGDRLLAQISLPLQELGLPRFKGRYLNGKGDFSLALNKGTLDIHALDLTVKGQPVPPTYMNAIRKHNLADTANENARASVGLNLLQSIEIRDSKVILVPKDNR